MSKLVSGPVERNRCLWSKHRCCSPEAHFLPMGHGESTGDGSDVTPTLSVITPDDGPWSFFPSLLYKMLLDLTSSDPTQPILSTLLAWFLIFFNFSPFLALEAVSLLEGNLSAHALMVACSLEIPTKEQIKHFCQPFRKMPAQKSHKPPRY